LQVDRGDRIGIFGPNGVGKTTLLRVLLGELQPDAGEVRLGTGVKIGYFDQQLTSVRPELSAVEAVRPDDTFQMTPGQMRSLLARFGVKGDLGLQTVGALSGGEKTKVALARLAALAPNVLVLDEPTNHLDFWSAAALERSLREFAGTVLFVSHDRYFLDQVATKVLVLESHRCRLYEGNYSDYQHFLKATSTPASPIAGSSAPHSVTTPTRSNGAVPAERRRRKFPYRRVEEIEADIASLESQIADLQTAMADPVVLRDGDRIRRIKDDYDAAQLRLSELVEHWEEALELN
jgi:ATP-binding cassette subfamily F protein 3